MAVDLRGRGAAAAPHGQAAPGASDDSSAVAAGRGLSVGSPRVVAVADPATYRPRPGEIPTDPGVYRFRDAEGRVISARVAGVRFVSVYLPSGSSGEVRQGFKERILGDYQAWVSGLLAAGEPLVIGGDYNIAHREIDLKNWRSNQKNSGFLPQEREWMTAHLASGLTDGHRECLGEEAEYTWWSNRANAYANNVGWRIDYLLAAGVNLREVRVDRQTRLSDHAPLTGWAEVRPTAVPPGTRQNA